MDELKSYIKYLDLRIGSSNDYYGMFEEGYKIDSIVEIIIESLQEMYDGTEEEEVIEWKEGIINRYASLEV